MGRLKPYCRFVVPVLFSGLMSAALFLESGRIEAADSAQPRGDQERSPTEVEALTTRGVVEERTAGGPAADAEKFEVATNQDRFNRINDAVSDALAEPSNPSPGTARGQRLKELVKESPAPDPEQQDPYLDKLRDEVSKTVIDEDQDRSEGAPTDRGGERVPHLRDRGKSSVQADSAMPEPVDRSEPPAVDQVESAAPSPSAVPPAEPAGPKFGVAVASSTDVGACPVRHQSSIDEFGIVTIDVSSECRGGSGYRILYGDYSFAYRLDEKGVGSAQLDLFLGPGELALELADGTRVPVRSQSSGSRFKRLAKAAIVWRDEVDLDLHAHEYSAGFGRPGHYHQDAPGDAKTAGETGMGRLTRTSDGRGEGDHAEVYTVKLSRSQRRGTIQFKVDYRSRGEIPQERYCGDGKASEIGFETVRLMPGDRAELNRVKFDAAECGDALSPNARYSVKVAPEDIPVGRDHRR